MRFTEAQLDRIRRVSPSLSVAWAEAETADYSKVDVLYAGMPPRDLRRAPALEWVQLHMAGVNALHDHPLYTASALPLTTTSGVHAGTIAEYGMTEASLIKVTATPGTGRMPNIFTNRRCALPAPTRTTCF